MLTIAVIGSNGQVGSEVCLHLSRMEGIRVIAICRSELGGSLLRRCGLDCRYGALDDPQRATQLLADSDVAADFSLPQGSVSEVRSATRQIVSHAVSCAPPGARFAYASSMMAFGMPAGARSFRPRLVSRTSYGATKRFGERVARRLAPRFSREAYVLRLGEVHGELQMPTRADLGEASGRPVHVPDVPSYSVFAATIAEALVHIGRGREEPGTYTLVSTPEWTWKELYEHHCRSVGVEPRVLPSPAVTQSLSRPRAWPRAAWERAHRVATQLASRHRELIAAHLLAAMPALERRATAIHRANTASLEIAAMRSGPRIRLSEPAYLGPIPGRRLRSLSDSRETLEARASALRQLLREAGVVTAADRLRAANASRPAGRATGVPLSPFS